MSPHPRSARWLPFGATRGGRVEHAEYFPTPWYGHKMLSCQINTKFHNFISHINIPDILTQFAVGLLCTLVCFGPNADLLLLAY